MCATKTYDTLVYSCVTSASIPDVLQKGNKLNLILVLN